MEYDEEEYGEDNSSQDATNEDQPAYEGPPQLEELKEMMENDMQDLVEEFG